MNFFKVYWRSLKMLWAEPWVTSAIVAAGLATAVVQLLEPLFFGRVIDALSQRKDCFTLLAVWAAMGVLNVGVSVFLAVGADRLAHRRRLTVIGEIFERAIGLPVSFHAEHGSGRVVRAILTGTDQLFALWLSFLREHLPSIVGVIALVPLALALNWHLALLLFALSLVYLIANATVLRRTGGRQARVESYHQDLFGRVGDVIGNVTVVQSYTRLADEMQGLQEVMARLLSAQYPVLTWWGILTVITRVSATLAMVSVLALGSWYSRQGLISVGEVVAFVSFSGLLIAKLDQISAFVARSMSQAPTLMSFFDLLERAGGPQESPQARPLSNVAGAVAFDAVSFRYPSGAGVFDLNFTVPAGQTIALVGPSGSGKTTTLALLQRLFDSENGSITIDGQDVKELTLISLRQSIAAVFQDVGLFNRSIIENIRVGKPSASAAEIEAAAQSALAHDFIMKKAGGYEFVIGERGSLLSGGERQRIAIARAILKNSPILILDEATSALDNETERKIQMAMANLRAGKTTFVIAHRLSTVISADMILVFEDGRIAQAGTYSELKLLDGVFNRLLTAGGIHAHG